MTTGKSITASGLTMKACDLVPYTKRLHTVCTIVTLKLTGLQPEDAFHVPKKILVCFFLVDALSSLLFTRTGVLVLVNVSVNVCLTQAAELTDDGRKCVVHHTLQLAADALGERPSAEVARLDVSFHQRHGEASRRHADCKRNRTVLDTKAGEVSQVRTSNKMLITLLNNTLV